MYHYDMNQIRIRKDFFMEQELQYSIRELRARKGETQKQTAESIGVSVQTYNSWEKHISNVSIGKVNQLAKHFGVKLTQILLD